MSIVGYARVSTADQNPALQGEALLAPGCGREPRRDPEERPHGARLSLGAGKGLSAASCLLPLQLGTQHGQLTLQLEHAMDTREIEPLTQQ